MKTEKIIQTIKKVLELSKNNPSEEEAKAAALKAQELLAKYHISMAEIEDISDTTEEISEVSVDVPAKKWKYSLATIVANNFRCKHFYYGKGTVVFYGHKTDAEVAAETFKYLFDMGNRCAGRVVDREFAKTGTSAGVYNSFVKGFCDGVSEVLGKQCTALMLVIPKDVNEAYDERSKSFRNMRCSGLSTKCNESCSEAYVSGKVIGRDAVSSKKLEG
jgi:hypothetical protein